MTFKKGNFVVLSELGKFRIQERKPWIAIVKSEIFSNCVTIRKINNKCTDRYHYTYLDKYLIKVTE